MQKILLVTNPVHDFETEYFDAWSQKVIDRARKNPG